MMAQQLGRDEAVIFPGYEKLGRMLQLRDAIDGQLSATQVATRMREVAVDIAELPDELVASFTASNVDERRDQLMKKVSKIHTGMEPVFEWIERRGTHETAKSLRTQSMWIFAEVFGCAECDIPEYAKGAPQRKPIVDPSNGWKRVSVLGSTIIRYAAQLRGLSKTIDGEVLADTTDGSQPQRRLAVDVEAGVVYIDERGIALNGTQPIKKRLAEFIEDLIKADGEYLKTPENIKTRSIEDQFPEVRDLIEAQSGAGRRIPRGKIWRD